MHKLTDARILVTGSTGFIASHLIDRLLEETPHIYALDKRPQEKEKVNFYNADLRDSKRVMEVINEIRPEIVYHLAGCINKNIPAQELENLNYQSTVNLLESLNNTDYKHFVYTSTAELYLGNKPPFSEDMKTSPATAYARSKLLSEEYCLKLFADKGKPITILRPFLIYGPRQGPDLFVQQLLQAYIDKREFKMTLGEQTRDFVYVKDAVDAFVMAANSPASIGEIINIASGTETKIKDIAEKINSLLGNTLQLSLGSIPYRETEIWQYFGDTTKAKKLLGWTPKTSLEKGLEETVNWYKNNPT